MTTSALERHLRWGRAVLAAAAHRQRGESDLVVAAEAEATRLEIDCRTGSRLAMLETPSLTATEERILVILAAASLDSTSHSYVMELCGSSEPTTLLLRQLVYSSAASATALVELGPSGTLRRLLLVEEATRLSHVTDLRTTWALPNRVLAWLHGASGIDHELSRLCIVHDQVAVDVATSTSSAIERARNAMEQPEAVVVASGAPGSGRRSLLLSAATASSRRVLEVDASRLATDVVGLRRQLRLIAREHRLTRVTVLISNLDAITRDESDIRLAAMAGELVPELQGESILATCRRKPAMRWGRPTIVIEMKPPTSAQRAKLWLAELGQGTPEDGEYLATQYPFAPALIHHAAKAAKLHASGRDLQPEDISAGVRAALDDKLGDYATRIEVTQTWDDLVLPDDQLAAIEYLIARIRQRRTVYEDWGFAAKVGKGLGTSALLSGPPGTGKTMVAALIAKELGLELYQVDMSKVTSKWIGETERNLAAVFDAAEAGHAVLLFDEADSLFGKRTEVKSSNDRYANLETNYLLQRLESFTGICLLTSNHESNIDPAFQRRLSLHVRFDLPDLQERAALWRAMIPAAAPVEPELETVDLARRFQMSGGYIRNAALRAAFLAADEGVAISSVHLERAARLEYEGMGKICA
jgi:AAA+ superfamily predicted ATPase